MAGRGQHIRRLTRHWSVTSAARFIEDRLHRPGGLDDIATAAEGGTVNGGQLHKCVEAAADATRRAQVMCVASRSQSRWVMVFLDLYRRAPAPWTPSSWDLVANVPPRWASVAHLQSIAPDPAAPPRLRDTDLCLAAPHGPTVAGVMPAA